MRLPMGGWREAAEGGLHSSTAQVGTARLCVPGASPTLRTLLGPRPWKPGDLVVTCDPPLALVLQMRWTEPPQCAPSIWSQGSELPP